MNPNPPISLDPSVQLEARDGVGEHTPGPWVADDLTTLICPELVSEDYHFVESVEPGSHLYLSFSGTKADALLIAAAPDLLEALERILQQADEGPRGCYGRDSGGHEDWKGSFHSRIEAARTAIAKATKGSA